MKKILSNFIKRKEAIIVLLILALIVFLSASSRTFLTKSNFESLQVIIAPNAIIAIGMTFLLISGTFDLSVGSVMGLAGAITAYLFLLDLPMPLAILGGLSVGFIFGLINGSLIAYLGVNPLIVTIGALYIGRGLLYVILSGEYRFGLPITHPLFLKMGITKFLGFYIIFIILIVLVVITQFILSKTYVGRQLYLIGGNYEAARSLGVRVKKVRFFLFGLSGLFAGLAGILALTKYESASPYLGLNLELNIIISCLIGGASVAGGKGSIIGSQLGVIFMALVLNLFSQLNIGSYWQNVIVGIILIFIISIDSYQMIRKKRTLDVNI